MSNVVYTKAQVDALLAQAQGSNELTEVSGTYPLRSTSTGTARKRWFGPDAPPTTTGYALNGDVWFQTP